MTRDIAAVARALGETLAVLRQEYPGAVYVSVSASWDDGDGLQTLTRTSGVDDDEDDDEGDELHAGPGAPPDGAGVRTGGAS